MSKLILELYKAQAANENSYESAAKSEPPDDWSHTIAVSSEQAVLNGPYVQTHAANEHSYNPDYLSEEPDDWSHAIVVSSDEPVMRGASKEHGTSEAEADEESFAISNTANTKAA